MQASLEGSVKGSPFFDSLLPSPLALEHHVSVEGVEVETCWLSVCLELAGGGEKVLS